MQFEVSLTKLLIYLIGGSIALIISVAVHQCVLEWRLKEGSLRTRYISIVKEVLLSLNTEEESLVTEVKKAFKGNQYVNDEKESKIYENTLREVDLLTDHPWITYLEFLGPEGTKWKKKMEKNPLKADITKVALVKVIKTGMLGKKAEQLLPLIEGNADPDLLEAIKNV